MWEQEYEQRQRRLAPLQNDPEWKEWLSDQDIGLAHFFKNVVTDMPADPYSRDGLRHAEAAALRIFPDVDAANPDKSPENNLIIDPFQRYIGEVFVRNFEGRWIYEDSSPEYGPEPCVEMPYAEVTMVVRPLLIRLVERGRGSLLASAFDAQQEVYEQWVKHGRPPYPQWADIEERLVDEGVL